MRTTLTVLTAALLLLLSVPVSAQEEAPLRLEPCSGDDVLTLEGDTTSVTAPMPPFGEETVSYRLDLSGQDVAEDADMDDRATVDVLMTWLTPFDYDLDVNGSESINLQPVDPSQEQASASVRHCGLVTITVTNFAAAGVEPIELATTVRL